MKMIWDHTQPNPHTVSNSGRGSLVSKNKASLLGPLPGLPIFWLAPPVGIVDRVEAVLVDEGSIFTYFYGWIRGILYFRVHQGKVRGTLEWHQALSRIRLGGWEIENKDPYLWFGFCFYASTGRTPTWRQWHPCIIYKKKTTKKREVEEEKDGVGDM